MMVIGACVSRREREGAGIELGEVRTAKEKQRLPKKKPKVGQGDDRLKGKASTIQIWAAVWTW